MPRPRKDQAEPYAPERIKNAFWDLLEQNDLNSITVTMVTQAAHCNRGTFYYHFDSIDDLLDRLIEEEMLSIHGLPLDLFDLLCEGRCDTLHLKMPRRAKRFGLLSQRAGHECVSSKIKAVIVHMWEAILCNGGNCLTLDTRLAIEYSVGGITSVIDYLYRNNMITDEKFPDEPAHIIRETASILADHISKSQGISRTELQARLKMFVRLMQLEGDSIKSTEDIVSNMRKK